MNGLKLKKLLIDKTKKYIASQNSSNKGSFTYQNSIALESLVSSDLMLNSKIVSYETLRKAKGELLKSIDVDTTTDVFSKLLPTLLLEYNMQFKELDNGELVVFAKHVNYKFVAVSKDKGTSWSVLYNSFLENIDTIAEGESGIYMDVDCINGTYYMIWSGIQDKANVVNIGVLTRGQLENIETAYKSDSALDKVYLKHDNFDRPVILSIQGNYLKLITNVNGSWESLEISRNTATPTILARETFVDLDGFFWLVQENKKVFSITKIDLSEIKSLSKVEVVHYTINEGDDTNVNILASFKDNKVLIIRENFNTYIFDMITKDFALQPDLKIVNDDNCVIITPDWKVFNGREYTTDFGKTWNILPLTNTKIRTNFSNIQDGMLSQFKNYLVCSVKDDAPNFQHIIIEVDKITNNDIIPL